MTHDDTPRTDGDSNGFALLVALVSLVALTAMATGGLWMSSSDFRSTDAYSESQRAFYVAEAALQEFVGTYANNPPSSVTYDATFGPGESATVEAVALASDPQVYNVEATSQITENGEVVSSRTVGATVKVDMSTMPPPTSAMLNLNGLQVNGAPSQTISGLANNSSGSTCPAAGNSVNGVEVPTDGYSENGGGGGNGVGNGNGNNGNGNSPGEGCVEYTAPTGSPDCVNEMSTEDLKDRVDIDWSAFKDGEAFVPDHTVSADGSDWPGSSAEEPTSIVVEGGSGSEFTLPKSGPNEGILIVPGDFTIDGSRGGAADWQGLILVGGKYTGNGKNVIDGAMLTGLNMKDGSDDVDESTVGNGNKDIQYDACAVWRARGAVSRMAVVPGTWYQGAGRG